MITCGIDCGTQSTKVICYDSKKNQIIANESSAHQLISKNDGSREQKANWYIEALQECFNKIDSEIKKQIKAIGVSGQQHGLVVLDENNQPITNVKLWCDTSTMKQCDTITERLGGKEEVFKEINNQILPGYTASKILYIKEHDKEAYNRIRHILLPHDYINFYLTGNFTMEEGDASGTAFFDVKNRIWSEKVLKAIDNEKDLRDYLPKLIQPNEVAGTVTKEVCKALGLQGDVIVSPGGGDNMMGAIGCGCTREGNLVMSLGTSGTLFGFSNKCISDKKGRLAAFKASSGGYLPLLCTMNCTVASEQFRALFEKDVKTFDSIASKAEIGCEGIVLLPYFNGERTPNYPNGKASLLGLDSSNTKIENITRATLESAIYSMKVGLEAFIEQGFKPKNLILIGGGSKSDLWCQMISDGFNLPVTLPKCTESAAFGGCLQSLAIAENEDLNTIVDRHCEIKDKSYQPNIENNKLYERNYIKYKQYDSTLAPLFK